MKIIFLNTWGGRVTEPLKKFFASHQDVDVFCLQEVWSSTLEKIVDYPDEVPQLFSEIGDILQSHQGIFAPADQDGNYGLALYFKKPLTQIDSGNIMIHNKAEYFPDLDVTSPPRNMQYVTFEKNSKKITVINFHGLWTSQGKGDNPDRLIQSEKIISFLKTLDHLFVLGGDFNLSPDTQSLQNLENFGLKNLVKEYGVVSTRTNFYTKENKFADYVLVSDGTTVTDFQVLPDEVSDHAPLCVTINP